MSDVALNLDLQPRVPDGAYRLGYEWRDGKPVGAAPEWARSAPAGGFVLEHMPPGFSMCAFWKALTNPVTLAPVQRPVTLFPNAIHDHRWVGENTMFAVERGHKLYGVKNVEPCRTAAELGYKLCSAHGGQTILAAGRRQHELPRDCPKCGAVVEWDYPVVTVEELRRRRVDRMRSAGATEEQVQSMIASNDPAINPSRGPVHDYSDEVAVCVGCRYCNWRENDTERTVRLAAYAAYIKE